MHKAGVEHCALRIPHVACSWRSQAPARPLPTAASFLHPGVRLGSDLEGLALAPTLESSVWQAYYPKPGSHHLPLPQGLPSPSPQPQGWAGAIFSLGTELILTHRQGTWGRAEERGGSPGKLAWGRGGLRSRHPRNASGGWHCSLRLSLARGAPPPRFRWGPTPRPTPGFPPSCPWQNSWDGVILFAAQKTPLQ